VTGALPRLEPLRYACTDVLEIAFFEAGQSGGEAVFLLHGFPYDIHSYVDVIPRLAAAGYRVIVPYLRGHGPTRFLDPAAPRSGQQAAIGADVIALMDALGIERAILAGYDWGGRAACIAAALWPQRSAGLVTVGSYLIQDIATAMTPARPGLEAGFWYFWYFLTDRGRAGLTASRRDIAKVIWTRNSPEWPFDDAMLDRAAAAFDNPDYVEIVLHSYRHRLGLAPSYPTARSRKALPPSRPLPSRWSPWTAWPMATSRPLTAARPNTTSPGLACTTRYRTRVTTSPRNPQTHSPARSWN
jgi:pimeloyl-ACP methyl ester carboxylesterase